MDVDFLLVMRDLLLLDFVNFMIFLIVKKYYKNKVLFNNYNDNVLEVEVICKMELFEMVEF